MAANPYARAPLSVAEIDPDSRRVLRAFFFLGSVPRAVLEAAGRAVAKGGDPRAPEWSRSDAATLAGFYGPGWRGLLTVVDPPELADSDKDALAARLLPGFFSSLAHDLSAGRLPGGLAGSGGFVGGARARAAEAATEEDEADGADDADDADDASDDLWAAALAGFAAEPAPESQEGRSFSPLEPPPQKVSAPLTWSGLAVYDDDTILDLRLKLSLAAGVPLWRQHFFFYVNDEGPVRPYRLTLDGAPVQVGLPGGGPAGGARVAGLAVDPRAELEREALAVEALDTLMPLGLAPGVRVTRAFFVDLHAVVRPLDGPDATPGLAAALRDRYQFDLLYYGALVRFWPQLSPDAAHIALAEPGRMAAAYPALAPSPRLLAARFAAERPRADAARGWRPPPEAAAKRAPVAVTAARVRVTPAAVLQRVEVRNVFDWLPTSPARAAAKARFEVDGGLLADPAEAVGPDARQGGALAVAAAKRHASSFGPRAAPTIDPFLERPPPRGSVAFALARSGAGRGEQSPPGTSRIPFATLLVYADGRYDVGADWREDDRVGFAAVAAELAALVAPTLAEIAAMGPAALPLGGELAPLSLAGRAALGGLTVSTFWPHALTAGDFRRLKEAFRGFEAAGLVRLRGLQQAGAYTFAWLKGVAYDPRLAARALGASGDAAEGARAGRGARNQYAWLTDATVAARWAALFGGRLVRLHHRATDLRVEVVAADSLEEFSRIRRYLFAFLDGLLAAGGPLAGLTRAARKDAGPERAGARAASRSLRRLQERDPALFDVKSFDPDAVVFARLCQGDHQPAVFDAAEAAALPAGRRARLTRYWNFTDDEPAWYECPHAAFPHLSFLRGRHPRGFCLPCCNMTRPPPGSRAARANAECLAAARRPLAGTSLAELEAEAALSRHVLAFGKATPPGRLSELPRELAEGLFLGAAPPPYALLAVGVEQACPAVPDAGFAYALAFAAAHGDTPGDAVLTELAAAAAAAGDAFPALGDGGGAAFESAAAVADAIAGAFVRREPAFSPLGPGGAAERAWRPILADLARIAFGLEVVVLDDPTGSGAVTLLAEAKTAAALREARGPGGFRPRLALFLRSPAGTHPVAVLDPRLYLRTEPGDRWMVARRTFAAPEAPRPGAPGSSAARPLRAALSDGPARGPSGRFAAGVRSIPLHLDSRPGLHAGPATGSDPGTVVDHVFTTVRDALGSPAAAGPPPFDLELAMRWLRGGHDRDGAPGRSSFALEARLVDLHGRCFGVLLRPATEPPSLGASKPAGPAGFVYLPVTHSSFAADGTPTLFGPRPAAALPPARLAEALADLNRFIEHAGEPHGPVERGPSILDRAGNACGFVSGREWTRALRARRLEPASLAAAPPRPELYWFHDAVAPAAAAAAGLAPDPDAGPPVLFPYDGLEVDRALAGAAAGRAAPPEPALARLADRALLRNRRYRLFLAEFAAVLRRDRDEALRAQLAAAISAARFDSPESVQQLRKTLVRLLRPHPEDLARARALIARAYIETPADPVAGALAALAATPFGFDRQGLARLRALPDRAATAAALRRLLADRVAPDAETETGAAGSNIFVACGEASALSRAAWCQGERLRAPPAELDDFFDILAADVRNLGKADLLAAASAGVFDPLDFIQRPDERLYVRFETR